MRVIVVCNNGWKVYFGDRPEVGLRFGGFTCLSGTEVAGFMVSLRVYGVLGV